MLQAVRDRAATRARQLVPLAAMLHSFMIAQRVISAAIAREAGHGARTRGAALTLQTWIDHDLNVAATAKALCMHPNSVRYRLRRIAQLTGHNPHHLTDLLELHSAARLLSHAPGADR